MSGRTDPLSTIPLWVFRILGAGSMEATITEETAHIIKAQMKNMKQGNVLMFDEVTGGFVTVVIQIGMKFAVHRKPKPKPQEQST